MNSSAGFIERHGLWTQDQTRQAAELAAQDAGNRGRVAAVGDELGPHPAVVGVGEVETALVDALALVGDHQHPAATVGVEQGRAAAGAVQRRRYSSGTPASRPSE